MAYIQKCIIPTLITIYALSYLLEVSGQNPTDQTLIRPVVVLLVALYVINTVKDIKETRKSIKDEKAKLEFAKYKKIVFLVSSCVVFFLIVEKIGFIISSILFCFTTLYILGVNNKKTIIIFPIVFSLIVYFIFSRGFGVPVPQGVLNI